MGRTIEDNVRNWAAAHLKDFTFREHQLEAICQIVERVIDPEAIKNQIIEAPTGSGKSIICVISAGVLADYYDKKSYILVSDLYLWQQYADFIKEQSLPFGYLKGLTGNYICAKNKEDLRNGECRVARIKYKMLFDDAVAKQIGFPCAKTCEYIQSRKKAVKSNVTLMTYQLYHYQLNIVRGATFEPRDVIFCDECHNIPEITQTNCTPCIQQSDFKHYLKIWDWANKDNMDLTLFDEPRSHALISVFPKRKDFEDRLYWYYHEMLKDNTPERDWELIESYWQNEIQVLKGTCEFIEEEIEKNYKNVGFDASDLQLYKDVSYARNHFCSIEDFYVATKDMMDRENGGPFFVKNINDAESGKMICFSCVKEDYMIWKYLFRHAPNRVLMSATVGLKEAFDDNIGIKYTEQKKSTLERIPSTFDFSKSPIYISEKYKMTYREKDESFPKLKEMTYKILQQHNTMKGIIQTGSYENAKKLWMEAPPNVRSRLLLYENSKEKEQLINKHKESFNTVLIGPSLNEGIDLPGDLCRFIIIFKIPYPQLQDKLVQAKMKVFPTWYKSKTSNCVIQGIGRGNRFKQDWCITYIIDGCFKDLLKSTKMQYSNEIKKRMKFFK